MRYGSVCSGIEAATAAWHSLGWEPVFFSEIEPFPCSVLAHHYPAVPNYGDMTKFKEWPDATIDVLVGGTPCQSFSVAGLRKGLDDPRGNLMLTYLAIADRYRPRWLVWENVPGVLSSNGGRDFGTFLGGLGELGYGFAYRILDAQYFGVPQRRRRVFVVGYLGDWRRAAAVLFERHSLSWDSAPSREKGEESAGGFAIGIDEECNAAVEQFGPLLRGGQGGTRQAVATLDASFGRLQGCSGQDASHGHSHLIPCGIGENGETARALTASLTATGRLDPSEQTFITHSLRGEGFDASEDGTGRGTPLVPVAFAPYHDEHDGRGGNFRSVNINHTLRGPNGTDNTLVAHSAVRRLTPRECERLQGFPDDYTLTPHRGKPAADGPRYKALGNSMAVPVMRWIGERIQTVEDLGNGRQR